MNDQLVLLLVALAGLVALIYLGGPVFVWFRVRSSMDPEVRVVEPVAVPTEAVNHDADSAPALRALGFEPRVWIAIEGFMRDQTWYLRAWANASSLDMASTNLVRQEAGSNTTEQTVVAFCSVFDGGRMIGTNNGVDPTPFPWRTSMLEEWMVPGEARVDRLHAVHRAAASVFGLGRMKRLPGYGAERQTVKDMIVQQMRDRAEAGFFVADELRREFRPTILGAIKMTWSQLPPLKQLRFWQIRRRVALLPTFVLADGRLPVEV